MSTRLRLAILAALALAGAGACAAAEPGEAKPAPVPAEAKPAPTPAEAKPAPAPPLSPLLLGISPPPPAASPLLPSLVPPPAPVAVPPPEPATAAAAAAAAEPVGPPAALAATPAMRSGAEVFARLRRGLSPDACNAGTNSTRWRERYAGSPVAFSRRMETVLPLLDFVSTEVEHAGLPAEFTFIPLVESWYQPGALGPGGPAGMWQMIGTTAQNHGIHIRDGYDGRLSPVESTRAALSYLKVLKAMFGDWQAIVMAYNAGEGRMQNALRRAGSRTTSAADRRPHGLSNITYDYVDKLQALSCLVSKPQLQGVRLPMDARFEPLVPLLMEAQVDSLDEFARAHGKDAALLRKLNPGFRNGHVVGGVPRLVLSPPGASAPPVVAVARSTPPPELLAVADVANPTPQPQQLLASGVSEPAPELVPVSLPMAPEPTMSAATMAAPAAAAAHSASDGGGGSLGTIGTPAGAPSPDPAPPVHEVRAGDTLASIAEQYHLPVEQIRRANNLERNALLRPGQRLRLVP
jgi:membrane-bound lytic murein transglycosylase D